MACPRSMPLSSTIAVACDRQLGLPLFGMHRDKPPGFFDFAERSIRYLVGFWFTTGLVLSILVHTGLLVWRADAKGPDSKRNPEALEAKAMAQKPASATTPPPATAVRY